MKKHISEDRDPLPSCSFCEWAKVSDDGSAPTYCTKYEKTISRHSSCPLYSYDLMKRRPLRLRSSAHLEELPEDYEL